MQRYILALLFTLVFGMAGANAQAPTSQEVDLGEFETVVITRDTSFTLKAHIYGVSANKDVQGLLEKNKARVRNGILQTLRSASWEHYADPELAVISKAVQRKLNEILGGGMFSEVMYTELKIVKLDSASGSEAVTQVLSPTRNAVSREIAATPLDETMPPPPRPRATNASPAQPANTTVANPGTNPAVPNVKVQDLELTNKVMIQGVNAIKAIQERVKRDPVLKQLSEKTPIAENLFFPDGDPDFIELYVQTADEWEDIPIKNPPYYQKGQGFMIIRFFGDFKYDAPRTAYKPPRGCYLVDETRKVAGSEARIVVMTRLRDANAGTRLVKIVEEECAKVGLKLTK